MPTPALLREGQERRTAEADSSAEPVSGLAHRDMFLFGAARRLNQADGTDEYPVMGQATTTTYFEAPRGSEEEPGNGRRRRVSEAVGIAMVYLAIGLAVIFLGWCVCDAVAASQLHYTATHGQRTYASRYCVSKVGGALGAAYVTEPDPFGTTGPTPRLVIRCTFGRKAYLMKIVNLRRPNETPTLN